MRPYSIDLRERVVAAVDRHESSLWQIAQFFAVSLSFLVRLLRRRRVTGSVQPAAHGGGRCRALDADAEQRLRALVAEQPDATLEELRQRLGIPCSRTAIWRALQRLQLSRKKKSLIAEERNRPKVQAQRQAFQEKLADIDPQRLIFVDESGTNTVMTRTYGRAPIGKRVTQAVPGQWESLTLLSSLRLSGVGPALAFPGATDGSALRTYVQQMLVPALQPGDIVVWDNLQAHKDGEAIRAIEAVGATVEPLPPWSPDLTPIEKFFSKVKTGLRTVAARTAETLIEGMGTVLDQVSPSDILGWFRSCGLCAQPNREPL
jgi:transposase